MRPQYLEDYETFSNHFTVFYKGPSITFLDTVYFGSFKGLLFESTNIIAILKSGWWPFRNFSATLTADTNDTLEFNLCNVFVFNAYHFMLNIFFSVNMNIYLICHGSTGSSPYT